jgi:hypothetical protein
MSELPPGGAPELQPLEQRLRRCRTQCWTGEPGERDPNQPLAHLPRPEERSQQSRVRLDELRPQVDRADLLGDRHPALEEPAHLRRGVRRGGQGQRPVVGWRIGILARPATRGWSISGFSATAWRRARIASLTAL